MVGKQGIAQFRQSISKWRVILPIEIDRDKYIYTCYETGTVSLSDGNEIIHRVKVGKLSLQLIDFPETAEQFGSEVVCVCDPYSSKLYIVDVYSSTSEINSQREGQYRLYKAGDGYAEVRIDGDGKILMTVNGKDNLSEVFINITSENKKGKLKLNVNGDIIIQNQGNTTLTSNQVMIKTLDDGKIYLNESEEPMLLGVKTVQLISDILDQLGKESAGPYPLLGNSIYLSFKDRLEELKSKISFVK